MTEALLIVIACWLVGVLLLLVGVLLRLARIAEHLVGVEARVERCRLHLDTLVYLVKVVNSIERPGGGVL